MLLDGQLVNSSSYTQNVTFTGTSTYLYANSPSLNGRASFIINGTEYSVPAGTTLLTSPISSGSTSVSVLNTSKTPTGWNYSGNATPGGIWVSSAYGNGTYVAVGWFNNNYIAYSTNGSTWNYISSPTGGAVIAALTFAQNTNNFVLLTNGTAVQSWTSTNGSTWTQAGSFTTSSGTFVSDIAYGNGILMANIGTNANNGSASNQTFISTNNATTWTAGGSKGQNANWTSLTYGTPKGKPTWVAANNGPNANGEWQYFSISTDNGASWTLTNNAYPTYWQSVIYANGYFYGFSSNWLTISQDG